MKNSQAGFSLATTLLSSVVGIIVAMLFGTLITNQFRQTHILQQKLEVLELKSEMIRLIQSPKNCSCQIDRLINTTMASQLRVNLSQPLNIPSLSLSQLHKTCDLSSTGPLLARANAAIPGGQNGLQIDSIQILDVTATGTPNQYHARIEIKVEDSANNPVSTVSTPFVFEIDPSTGTVADRRLSHCLGENQAGLRACPTGWTMVGPPMGIGTFCIDSSPRYHPVHQQAMLACSTVRPVGYNYATMCAPIEWIQACRLGAIHPTTYEGIASVGGPTLPTGGVAVSPSCTGQIGYLGGNYRCCIH